MQKMSIDKILKILNDAKTNGATEVSVSEFNISYRAESETNHKQYEIKGDKKKEFKQFLISSGKTINVANAYSAGITATSKFLNENLWDIINPDEIYKLIETLSINSGFKEMNDSKSGTPNAALKRYAEFLTKFTKKADEDKAPSRVKGFFKNSFFNK